MYITRVEIKAIRSIKHLVWEIDVASAAGWHVILGDNGSGKSTFTRCVALSLIGQRDAQFLRLEWDSWIRVGERQGSCELNISIHENIDFDTGSEIAPGPFHMDANNNYTMDVGVMVLEGYIQNNGSIRRIPAFLTDATNATHNHLIAEKKFAGFSNSFGPFRRFTGGELEDEKLSESNPQAYRHLSAFSERVALTEGLKWLKQLQFEAIDTVDRNPDAALLIESVRNFVNQGGLLPNGVRLLHISSAGVKFQDGNGSEILAEEMSDGYRSVLALTFELLRQLSVAYGPDIFQTQDGGKVTVSFPAWCRLTRWTRTCTRRGRSASGSGSARISRRCSSSSPPTARSFARPPRLVASSFCLVPAPKKMVGCSRVWSAIGSFTATF